VTQRVQCQQVNIEDNFEYITKNGISLDKEYMHVFKNKIMSCC